MPTIEPAQPIQSKLDLPKPGNLPDFTRLVQSMADFWLGLASLPQKERQ
jgi:hypothetical protein